MTKVANEAEIKEWKYGYFADTNGNVYNKSGKLMKSTHSRRGYPYVRIYFDGKKHKVSVHRIIAETFIPNPYNYSQVNHKDKDRKNAHVDNLEWCTAKYNVEYSKAKSVEQIDNGKVIAQFSSAREAERVTGIRECDISACCTGFRNRHTAKGYEWRFASYEYS